MAGRTSKLRAGRADKLSLPLLHVQPLRRYGVSSCSKSIDCRSLSLYLPHRQTDRGPTYLALSLKAGQKTLAWRRAEEGGARAERQVARRDGQVSNSRDARAHCVCSFRSVVDPACLPACARWLRRACGRHALTLCNVYVFGDTLCTRRPCCPCVGQQRTRWEVEG